MRNERIWAAVSMTALGCGLAAGVTLIGTDAATLGQITVMLGMIATSVPALISAKRSDETNANLKNGTVEALVRSAIEKIAEDETTSLEIKQEGSDSER